MAITRAQIAKQLLAQGGRIGLKGGADAATESFGKSIGYEGPSRPDRDLNIDSRGNVTFTPSGSGDGPSVVVPLSKPEVKPNIKEKFVPPMAKILGFITQPFRGSKFAMLNNAIQRQNFLRTLSPEDQVKALQDLAAIGIGTKNPMGIDRNIERGMEDSGFLGTGIGGGKFITDPDFGAPEAKAVLNEYGYDDYLDRNKTDNERDDPTDPCKGPNPPAYCFIGARGTENITKKPEEIFTPNLRLLAEGGRAGFNMGGAQFTSGSNISPGTDVKGNVRDDNPFRGGDGPPRVVTPSGGGGGPTLTSKKDIPVPSDFSKINFADLINLNLINQENEKDNMLVAGLNQEQVDYLNKVGKKVLKVSPEGGDFFTYDNPADVKKEIESLNPESESGFISKEFNPDKIVAGDPNTYATDKDVEDYIKTQFPNLKMGGKKIGLAEGGMPYEGGIMDLESARQMYGLGKLVKKVTRGIKKIAKSPIGKAALFAGVAGIPFGGGKFFGPGSLFGKGAGFLRSMGINKALLGTSDYQGGPTGILDLIGKNPLLAIGGASALAGLYTAKTEDEEEPLYPGADIDDPRKIMANPYKYLNIRNMAEGGSTEKEPVAKKTMPLLDMGGMEKDYREEGGFVPIGRMEKADDVPARLSKNEFVFTADAVRNAGDGDVDLGAEKMYNMMKNLEAGGDVSEESQGLEGAREMFQTSKRLEEVL